MPSHIQEVWTLSSLQTAAADSPRRSSAHVISYKPSRPSLCLRSCLRGLGYRAWQNAMEVHLAVFWCINDNSCRCFLAVMHGASMLLTLFACLNLDNEKGSGSKRWQTNGCFQPESLRGLLFQVPVALEESPRKKARALFLPRQRRHPFR